MTYIPNSTLGIGILYEFTVTVAQGTISVPTAGFPSGTLRIELSAVSTSTNNACGITFNGDTGATNYSSAYQSWTSSDVISGSSADGFNQPSIRSLNIRPNSLGNFQTMICTVSEWDDTDRFTNFNAHGVANSATDDPGTQTAHVSGQWKENIAVITIDFTTFAGLFDVGTRVRVYSA